METVDVTIRMSQNDKILAEKLFSDFGLTMNATLNMFIKQSLREQGIPFKITKNNGVQFMDKNTLDELSNKSDQKYGEAYKELAK